MTLVKAQMSFYHDLVGTRAKDEKFEIESEQLISELEQAGYIQRVDGEELQAHETAKSLQQQVGQRNALTNEAVSLAGHVQNMETLQHQANFEQMRQQAGQAAVEAEIARLEQAGEAKRAEQLRSGLESQRQAVQQQQQTQSQAQKANMAQAQHQQEHISAEELAQQQRVNQAATSESKATAKKADK